MADSDRESDPVRGGVIDSEDEPEQEEQPPEYEPDLAEAERGPSPSAKNQEKAVNSEHEAEERSPDEEQQPEGSPVRPELSSGDSPGEQDSDRAEKQPRKEGGEGATQKRKNLQEDDGGGKKKKRPVKKKPPEQRDVRADEREMWDHIAGAGGVDSEDDVEGVRTRDDEAFIDDAGVERPDGAMSDGEEGGSIGAAPQAEEAEEEEEDEVLRNVFGKGKARKNRKAEFSGEEFSIYVEEFMAKMDLAAENDAKANAKGYPALNKLKLLPTVVTELSKRHMQSRFMEVGGLAKLRAWMEPLPDGSLPNINIRSAIFGLLNDMPIDTKDFDKREWLKDSGLGKVVKFYSKLSDETRANRRLAEDLVNRWSRPLFEKSTRYEDMHGEEDDNQRPQQRRPAAAQRQANVDDDLDGARRGSNKEERIHAAVPRSTGHDFARRPKSLIDEAEAERRSKSVKNSEMKTKMEKKFQKLRQSTKGKMRAAKISVEGRGLVKYV